MDEEIKEIKIKKEKKSRKEWVKTFAIIFLAVLLVLTFFSNTIMNYSLPEVSAQYMYGGTITSKVRKKGSLESGNLVKVLYENEARKVTAIKVRKDDHVNEGDVICTLDEAEPEDLTAARDKLKSLQEAVDSAVDAYDQKILSADLDAGIRRKGGTDNSVAGYRDELLAIQDERDAIQENINVLNATKYQPDDMRVSLEQIVAQRQVDVDAFQAEADTAKELVDAAQARFDNHHSEDLPKYLSASSTSYEKTYLEYQGEIEDLKNRLESLQADIAYYQVMMQTDPSYTDRYNEATQNATEITHRIADDTYNMNQAAREILKNKNIDAGSYENDLDAAILQQKSIDEQLAASIKERDRAQSNLTAYTAEIDAQIATATAALNAKNEELTSKSGSIMGGMELDRLRENIVTAKAAVDEQQAEIDKMVKKAAAQDVVATASGRITELNAVSGEKIPTDQPVALIQPDGTGFTLSLTDFTIEEAKRVSVGDVGELYNSWWYNNVEIKIRQIKTNPKDPKTKTVVCDVTGEDLVEGQSLDVQFGSRSSNYDNVVPNSSIREDSNGKFVLVVTAKSSPLGNRYFAERFDVEVIASDETQSAVKGAFSGGEMVITTSTKPVEAGKQVRWKN